MRWLPTPASLAADLAVLVACAQAATSAIATKYIFTSKRLTFHYVGNPEDAKGNVYSVKQDRQVKKILFILCILFDAPFYRLYLHAHQQWVCSNLI